MSQQVRGICDRWRIRDHAANSLDYQGEECAWGGSQATRWNPRDGKARMRRPLCEEGRLPKACRRRQQNKRAGNVTIKLIQ